VDTFLLEIATPEKSLVKEQVSEAQIPGADGYLGILPDHAPLLSRLNPGILTYKSGGKENMIAVHGGFLEVKDNHVRCLVDQAERAEEIDLARAEAARNKAIAALNSGGIDLDIGDALAEERPQIGQSFRKAHGFALMGLFCFSWQ
jgi:F-type H+-transporting ATPase subunit epsilon